MASDDHAAQRAGEQSERIANKRLAQIDDAYGSILAALWLPADASAESVGKAEAALEAAKKLKTSALIGVLALEFSHRIEELRRECT